MPFKFNAARRHRIPRARYRVRNWPQYEAGLKRCGDLTLWIGSVHLVIDSTGLKLFGQGEWNQEKPPRPASARESARQQATLL